MEIRFAHLCDYANASSDGKLSVMGIFNNINVAQVPAKHPRMYLAFQIDVSSAEIGRDMVVEIHCVDADGNGVFKMQGRGKFDSHDAGGPRAGRRAQINQVLTIDNVEFKRTDAHEINIFLNNSLATTVTFTVTRLPAAAAGSPGE